MLCVPPQFSSVQLLSCVQLFATPGTAAHQASLSITNSGSLLKLMSIESVIPSNHLIPSSPSPPAFNLSQHQFLMSWRFASGSQCIGALALSSVLPMNIQDWDFLYDWLVWYPCSPRDSQESSPMPHFKNINFWHSAFFIVQLTSIHDYWKNHNFD